MSKSGIFSHALNIVSEVTEVNADDIVGECRRSDVVDARSILVHILYEHGFYTRNISEFMGRTGSDIRYLETTFDNRKKANRMIDINLRSIRKRMFSE